MQLRDYQQTAVDSTIDLLTQGHRSLLGVAATGMGKTVIFAHVAKRVHQLTGKRVKVLAHREELIFQAADKITQFAGLKCDIEMADMLAIERGLHGKADVVVSTIQTQNAGRTARMERFDPEEFGLLIVDEAHHAVAASYRKVIDYYRQNDQLGVFGVTATPDRKDESALGQVFDEVAFDFGIEYGVEHGWLVPITQRMVHVEGLDFSSIRTTAGDLNGADLAQVLEYEETLHSMVTPTVELVGDRRALVFCATVAQAERFAEIVNRHRPGVAQWISGKTDKDRRRRIFRNFSRGSTQYLVNVGVATEGFDDPGVEVVVMARPTKSRALYCQMVGRGTRPLPGTVDMPGIWSDATIRTKAIAGSAKPKVEIIDFHGNAGRHRLISTADILGGNYDDQVVQRAKAKQESGEEEDTKQALDAAQAELFAEQQAEKDRLEAEERAQREQIVARAKYQTSTVDPFNVFNLKPWREKPADQGKPITPKMRGLLERAGIESRGLTFVQARQLCNEVIRRWKGKLCSYQDAQKLQQLGLPSNVGRKEAKRMLAEHEAGRPVKAATSLSETYAPPVMERF